MMEIKYTDCVVNAVPIQVESSLRVGGFDAKRVAAPSPKSRFTAVIRSTSRCQVTSSRGQYKHPLSWHSPITRSVPFLSLHKQLISGLRATVGRVPYEKKSIREDVMPRLKDSLEASSYPSSSQRPVGSQSKKRKLRCEDIVERALPSNASKKARKIHKKTAGRRGHGGEEDGPDAEKRLRRYRARAPQTYMQKLHRAQTQR